MKKTGLAGEVTRRLADELTKWLADEYVTIGLVGKLTTGMLMK